MSLLLTFFVLLVSLSDIDKSKEVSAALVSIKGGLGVLPGNVSSSRLLNPENAGKVSRRSLERAARTIREQMQVLGRESDLELKFEDGGLKISLPSQVLFDTAMADVKPEATPMLAGVGEALKELTEAVIEVRGFTDNRPLTSSRLFRDNYDLSFARAKSVAELLHQMSGIPMERYEMIALGPSQPVATNETEEGRAANRRVELFVRAEPDDLAAQSLLDSLPQPTAADAAESPRDEP